MNFFSLCQDAGTRHLAPHTHTPLAVQHRCRLGSHLFTRDRWSAPRQGPNIKRNERQLWLGPPWRAATNWAVNTRCESWKRNVRALGASSLGATTNIHACAVCKMATVLPACEVLQLVHVLIVGFLCIPSVSPLRTNL